MYLKPFYTEIWTTLGVSVGINKDHSVCMKLVFILWVLQYIIQVCILLSFNLNRQLYTLDSILTEKIL